MGNCNMDGATQLLFNEALMVYTADMETRLSDVFDNFTQWKVWKNKDGKHMIPSRVWL